MGSSKFDLQVSMHGSGVLQEKANATTIRQKEALSPVVAAVAAGAGVIAAAAAGQLELVQYAMSDASRGSASYASIFANHWRCRSRRVLSFMPHLRQAADYSATLTDYVEAWLQIPSAHGETN